MTRDTKRYSKEDKEKLISRMLPPENISPSDLSRETGISKSTLATWKAKVTNNSTSKRNSKNMSSREKFLIVMETYTLSEIELSQYCREHGLYVEEVKSWRSSCIAANDGIKLNTGKLEEESKEDKRKIKELSKDLRLKEKALAETTALLVLRKKLNAIFGENEED